MSTPWRVAVVVLALSFILIAAAGVLFSRREFNSSLNLAESRCIEKCRDYSDTVRYAASSMTGVDPRPAVSTAMWRTYASENGKIGTDGLLMRYYYEASEYDEYCCGTGINADPAVLDGKDEAITIVMDGAERYAVAGKISTVFDSELFVFTLTNVTSIYEKEEKSFLFTAAAAAIISAICAAAGGFTAYLTKRRIDRFSDSIGGLGVRFSEKGAAEIREAARRYNIAAGDTEDKLNKAEAVAQGRKEFVDRLAHEMKTPLTSILCIADLLRIRRTVPDGERIEHANIIVGEANRLKKMSSKLLELATAGGAELEKKPTSALEILCESVEAMRPALNAKGINLEIRDGSEDGTILCDRELFKSLIYNIVDNAAKASEAGQTVTLTSRLNGERVVISVTDRGIGMTKDVLKRITEPFYMADKARSRKEGGAGIGLSLCVEIAQRHGADMSARSKPGKGTTVSISVPLYKEASE